MQERPQTDRQPWQATILTLFPDMFPGPLAQSITGKALEQSLWQLDTVNIRDFAYDRHKTVDDTPFGGGAGMVMRPDIIDRAILATQGADRPLYYLSPRGRPFDQAMARQWASQSGVRLLCGRYEGIDQRVIDKYAITEISAGDFILTGGELAAMLMIDAAVRLLEGVLGSAASLDDESFEQDLLEYPLYTRPADWEGRKIPDVLLSGHHEKIRVWRQQMAEQLTQERRPDLWARFQGKAAKTKR